MTDRDVSRLRELTEETLETWGVARPVTEGVRLPGSHLPPLLCAVHPKRPQRPSRHLFKYVGNFPHHH